MIRITPHPNWVHEFLSVVKPYEERVVSSKIFRDVMEDRLTEKVSRSACLNFYPLIEAFPQFLALNLAKVPAGNSRLNRAARSWLIINIQQERLHADWWRRMARKFGVPAEELNQAIYPPPEIDGLNNYLWRICTHGSLAEGVSAANFAVEGPTGQWTKLVKKGFEAHRRIERIEVDEEALEWIEAHASYDDKHPIEALEIIKAYATTEEEQAKVTQAAKRALEYYALALESCYRQANQT